MGEHLKVRILVLDDDEVIRSVIERKFVDSGIEATYFTNPYLYLDAISSDTDIAVIDYLYTGYHINGVEVKERTKIVSPDCEVIIISSNSDPAVWLQFKDCSYILSKVDSGWPSVLVFCIQLCIKKKQEEVTPKHGKKNRIFKNLLGIAWAFIKLKLKID